MTKKVTGFTIKATTTKEKNDSIEYKVVEKIGVLGKRKGMKGRDESLELRLVSWNGRDPKYDIRPWYKDENGTEKMSKGITMSGEELLALRDLLMEAEAE